ncbi:MAG: polysaccharide deacetylase family protein [Prolixibacteraceae bacterium]|nr:polysaccharide deacetylase family protein [Prolixibacteraceae bacterium]
MEKEEHIQLIVLVPEVTPRVEYIFNFLFTTILGTKIRLTSKQSEFEQSTLPLLNYTRQKLSKGLFLFPHSLLFEKKVQKQNTEIVEFQEMKLLFTSSDDSFLPFDPFAYAFYLVTRYEEYLAENPDEFDRFSDSENLLVRNGLHQKPVVDQLAFLIAEKISVLYPKFEIRKRAFKFVTTIDVDNAWAFKNKSFLVSLGAVAKAAIHFQWTELKQRLVVFLGLQNDPYDTYKYILETYKSRLEHILFFFLIGDRNPYDKNISHKNKNFRQLIANISSVCEVGIHPSFASNQKPWLFEKEKERLEGIIQKPVLHSRQHYLKLRFPGTYQNLQNSGITNDYTMGFASVAGFRAGTCTPFPFFDLSKNHCTELTIHPFQVMDVTLKNYMHLNTQQAEQLIDQLMLEVKKVDGTFVSLWHNESLKDSGAWEGWRHVFERIQENGLKYTYE